VICGKFVRMSRPALRFQLHAPSATLIFEIRREGGRWVVRLCNNTYGGYLNRRQARLDAIDAAIDARQAGHQVEVWVRSTNTRMI
jgi:hypothetical protein